MFYRDNNVKMMSTERLKIIHKQEQNQRKFVCVMNDVAKTQQELYSGYIEKEKHEAAQKSDKAIVVTRRNIVRQRVLKKCMKSKREEIERSNAKKIYGQYHGVPVEQIANQIDTFLEKNHPKVRRRQKINELFQEGYSKGAILDDNTIHNKVNDYFERPLVEVQHIEHSDIKDEEEIINSTFPAFSKPFYTGNFQTSSYPPVGETDENENDASKRDTEIKEKLFVDRKVSKFLKEDVPDDVSVQSEAPANYVVTRHKGLRPLTLPPIKIGTDNAVPQKKSKQKVDCISELIARIHKAKDCREKEIKIKKERRAKRLQHERVFGIGSSIRDDRMDSGDNSHDLFSDWENNPWKASTHSKVSDDEKNKRTVITGTKLPPLTISNSKEKK